MIGAIKNELIKLFYSRKIPVIFGIMLTFLLLTALVLFVLPDDEQQFTWKDELRLEQESLLQMEQTDKIQEKLATVELRLDKGIPLDGIESGANELLGELTGGITLMLLIPIFVIIICGELVIAEVNEGTLKYSLISQLSRNKILLAKVLAASIAIASVLIIYYGVIYLMCSILTGFGGWTNPVIFNIGGEPLILQTWIAILVGILANILCVFTYIALALFLSTWLQNVVFVTVSMVMCFMYSVFLSLFIEKAKWLSYFFISNINIYKLFDGSAITLNYVSSPIVLFILFIASIIALYIIAFFNFKRKDFII